MKRSLFLYPLLCMGLLGQNFTFAAAVSNSQVRAERALTLAYTTKEKGDYERAAALLEEAIQQQPTLTLHKSLAYLYVEKLKQPAQAYPHLEEITRQDPDRDWLLMFARTASQTGRSEQAVSLYSQIEKQNPKDAWTRIELAKILRELKRLPEARVILQEALQIDPANNYARAELAGIEIESARYGEARALVAEMKIQEPSSATARVLAGDILRKNWDLKGSEAAYRSALEINPTDVAARSGLQKSTERAPSKAGVTYYQFEDSDQLRQTGIYNSATVPLAGRYSGIFAANFLHFEREPFGSASRVEIAAGVLAHVDAFLTVYGGITAFETENLDSEVGFDGALYISPTRSLDLSLGYSSQKPVNDSIQAVLGGLTQNVTTGSVTLRVWSNIVLAGRGSYGEYADGNERKQGVMSVGWETPWLWFQKAAIEYEIVQFSERTSAYSSPENERIFRPVLQLAPNLTDWLVLELRGELPYLVQEKQWGHGLAVGLRAKLSSGWSLGATWLDYEIPGGQASWSGEGFKLEVNCVF